MEKLKTEFTYKAFAYKEILRSGNYAIYEYTNPKWESQRKYFDVIEIIIIPETVYPNGVKVFEHESYPRDHSWGAKAWTFTTLENAKNKFRKLTK